MKKVKSLPEPKGVPVGTCVRWDGRVYEKMPNGRWGPSLTVGFLAEIEHLYCDAGLNLREVAKRMSLPGHPKLSHSQVQRICNAEGWMRSHYGDGAAQEEYVAKNLKKLQRAVHGFGLLPSALADALGINADYLWGRFGNKNLQAVAKQARLAAGQLESRQAQSWNKLLSLDVQSLTYRQYLRAVRQLTELVLIRFGEHLDLKNRGKGIKYEHLDHCVTVFQGFWTRRSKPTCYGQTHQTKFKRKEVLPLALMCHPVNLQVLKHSDNCSKRYQSDLTTEALRAEVARSKVRLVPIDSQEYVRKTLSKLNLKPLK